MFRMNRRAMLAQCGVGFGMLGLASLFADEARAAAPTANPSQSPPANGLHHPAKAKRVIFIFLSGGPSHVDLLDPKPELAKYAGKPLPFEQPKLVRTRTGNLLPSPWKFKPAGKSGIAISELMPHLASVADDLCVIRSMHADNINHNGACLQMNTGEQAFSRPSLGSWLTYGLGSENRNLPGFVVISPAQPAQGAPLWSSSFLPAEFQGTLVSNLDKPIANLADDSQRLQQQRTQLDALQQLNRLHQQPRSSDSRLNARIESFELAFRMQREAPEAFDLSRESATTRALYGIDDPITNHFGRQCLMARRLVERGVRMVQVYHTQTSKRSSCQLWDQHGGLRSELPANCLATDRPVAALLKDLKSRGLLDDTLVVWGGEFGRTPTAENADGREHHPFGFSMWMAGGGIKGGITHGATDDFGWHAVQDKVHVHDLHATILHLMGIDHERLTYRYGGRDYRLTDVHGHVVTPILA
ncbi:DUF1501 domain-containing protein [Tuwongella immobilis]|uniref:Sulfatase n=1 Tax=Tuwongella immobilis TaxID=692036 RepID=A0A6C2YJ62_9BACT|nr:DUF1501 domain-containing protein [Tuwongella immobilis]VIP01173.1 secreted protein containing duf1501 : Uncharacterized protein OS=Singulisphaera acidiphila (strain ATCC BAA-1392 / DSM 18658 / VKM B-2454 / MOB10) GN=Sinac_6003 PE=4 SV=1: DUF1501 [Tuwongella immobilis]VTR97772.1 secreted protein containing duf1501 : Uncharacterized protein OS=Singulisphaera acidiphila (strain ATCC BAA-1392 / DSM 18658 / VKM B-2454 / MOB10) GN=Sinac_6003 PE=4 SV=1: DUF1501 [Tuwongella immobilis]